jgi:hypothetical protein
MHVGELREIAFEGRFHAFDREIPLRAGESIRNEFSREIGKRIQAATDKIVDLKFVDLIGTWQHFSITLDELSESLFTDGIGFDGSSIRGFQAIHESDMLLVPDPNWYMLDPFTEVPTLVMIGDIVDPITKQHYERDPRYIAQKAEKFTEALQSYQQLLDDYPKSPKVPEALYAIGSICQNKNLDIYRAIRPIGDLSMSIRHTQRPRVRCSSSGSSTSVWICSSISPLSILSSTSSGR